MQIPSSLPTLTQSESLRVRPGVCILSPTGDSNVPQFENALALQLSCIVDDINANFRCSNHSWERVRNLLKVMVAELDPTLVCLPTLQGGSEGALDHTDNQHRGLGPTQCKERTVSEKSDGPMVTQQACCRT